MLGHICLCHHCGPAKLGRHRMTKKKTKSMRPKAKTGQIRYDPTTCIFTVSDIELQRLQRQYPYDDIQAAVTQSGEHTRGYPASFRQKIEADPSHFLEFDLEWQLFRPKPEQEPQTLSELARQIKLCPTFIREALIGEVDMELAGQDLAIFYRRYYELGGTGFEPTNNADVDLARLLELCGEDKRLPRLQEIDVKILKHLNEAEFTKMQAELEMELNIPRKTIGKRLRRLRGLGLTHRVLGKRGGEAISALGRHLLEKL